MKYGAIAWVPNIELSSFASFAIYQYFIVFCRIKNCENLLIIYNILQNESKRLYKMNLNFSLSGVRMGKEKICYFGLFENSAKNSATNSRSAIFSHLCTL